MIIQIIFFQLAGVVPPDKFIKLLKKSSNFILKMIDIAIYNIQKVGCAESRVSLELEDVKD